MAKLGPRARRHLEVKLDGRRGYVVMEVDALTHARLERELTYARAVMGVV